MALVAMSGQAFKCTTLCQAGQVTSVQAGAAGDVLKVADGLLAASVQNSEYSLSLEAFDTLQAQPYGWLPGCHPAQLARRLKG